MLLHECASSPSVTSKRAALHIHKSLSYTRKLPIRAQTVTLWFDSNVPAPSILRCQYHDKHLGALYSAHMSSRTNRAFCIYSSSGEYELQWKLVRGLRAAATPMIEGESGWISSMASSRLAGNSVVKAGLTPGCGYTFRVAPSANSSNSIASRVFSPQSCVVEIPAPSTSACGSGPRDQPSHVQAAFHYGHHSAACCGQSLATHPLPSPMGWKPVHSAVSSPGSTFELQRINLDLVRGEQAQAQACSSLWDVCLAFAPTPHV